MKTPPSLLNFLLTLSLITGQIKPDPNPLQDYCIADNQNPQSFFLDGSPCINPKEARPTHFGTSDLSKPGNTKANQFGFYITQTNTINLPGLNTLGLTLARVDIAANGLVPPHWHPRASEVTICLEGALLVGFVDTSDRLYTQNLGPGESFVFPKGLIHFLFNMNSQGPALTISGFNSQNPGAQIASGATFTSEPPIPDVVLTKAFNISASDVTRIRRNLGG
ncbi:hypothetical protein UlMin_040378 [Ulmus minor]